MKELVPITPDLITRFSSIPEARDFYQHQTDTTKPFWYKTTERLTGLMVQAGINPPELLQHLLDLPQDYLHHRHTTEALQAEIRHFKTYHRLSRYVNNRREGPDYHLSQADPEDLKQSFKSINKAVQSSQLFDSDQKRQVEEWLVGRTSQGGFIAKCVVADIIYARTDRLGNVKQFLTHKDMGLLRDAHIVLSTKVFPIIASVFELFEPSVIREESPPILQAA